MHVHVTYGGGEAIFYIGDKIELKDSHNMKIQELSKAQKLVVENKNLIVEKWNEYTNK
ncbi:MAG: DUF4160 domain-containing protein [Candidatus Marinimicrobia bacterium]|nr:DUF4160 domain-containing protein [Candidatus Neomarinimicrobiota bacterium]